MFKIFDFTMLRNKREIEIDGEKIIDLTEPVIEFNKPLRYSKPPVLVTKEFEGRPCLISESVYNDPDSADLLMFFNGISNPFMIQAGMILSVPDIDSIQENIKDNNLEDKYNESKKELNKKLPKKDKERIKHLMKKAGKSPIEIDADDIRTPNMAKEGIESFIAKDGRIILGTNVSSTRCRDTLSPTQTLTEMIREKVKNKLIKKD